MSDTLKTSICDALAAFVRQRPGFDYSNYGDAASYRADSRRASLQKRDAETLLAAVRWRESITGADLIEAARGGRLTITPHYGCATCDGSGFGVVLVSPDGTTRNVPCINSHGTVRIDYCTGQYFPTEFRAGVCRVLSSALWNWQREAMPEPTIVVTDDTENGRLEHRVYGNGISAGDWLRAKFRREFGSSLARRWFN